VVAMLKDAFRNELVTRNVDHQERLLRYNQNRVQELEAIQVSHNNEMAALRDEESLGRATMINDHQQHATSIERQCAIKLAAQEEEAQGREDALQLQLRLKSTHFDEVKAELQISKKNATRYAQEKLALQGEVTAVDTI